MSGAICYPGATRSIVTRLGNPSGTGAVDHTVSQELRQGASKGVALTITAGPPVVRVPQGTFGMTTAQKQLRQARGPVLGLGCLAQPAVIES